MQMKKICMPLACLILITGCANNVWVKKGASASEFNMDNAQCNAQAYSIPFASVYQQAIVQNECLQGKGWTLRDRDAHDASSAQAQSSWQSVMSKHDADSLARCKDPAFITYFQKTACYSKDISFEQMADATKITAQQKPVLMGVKKSIDAQNAQLLYALKSIPNAPGEKFASLFQVFAADTDKNTLDLYTGKITWGDYSQKRKDLASKLQESLKGLR